jgi:chemotaxis signal transduction protein
VTAIHVRVRAGGEHYALPVRGVTEVTHLGELTPVPGAGRGLLGVRNLRGQVVPVVDFATLVGLDPEAGPTRIVVAEEGGRRVALAVESVVDVGPLPPASEAADSGYLTGTTLVDGELVGIVDIAAALDGLTGTQPA